jgi:hypothetical protein
MKAQSGSGDTAVLWLNLGAMEVGGQRRAPSALLRPITGGWVGSRASLNGFWQRENHLLLPPTGDRTPDCLARSKSLYRLLTWPSKWSAKECWDTSEEVTGDRRKLLSEKHRDLYSSVNAAGIGKSRTGGVRHVACMEQVKKACNS